MLALQGPSALTSARFRNVLEAIYQKNPELKVLSAHYVHYVSSGEPLGTDERLVLDRLLHYGPSSPEEPITEPCSLECWVIPRVGTISPWSSKATDIAHICGLDAIQRIERGIYWSFSGAVSDLESVKGLIHDRMTQSLMSRAPAEAEMFAEGQPKPLNHVSLGETPEEALSHLSEANRRLGLALSDDELVYLRGVFLALKREPSDVELMMFAQANSEHCRHKIFNANFVVDDQPQAKSLFKMIRNTTEKHPAGVLSAYSDNAAVMSSNQGERFFPESNSGIYRAHAEPVHLLMKVETHNHPTAIAPYAGAATGSGGEIRDEGATGRGAKPKAGMVGYTVSNLRIPGAELPWEKDFGRPNRIASALDIMTEAPLGGAAFNNEFGRPAICGYFRTFELELETDDPVLAGRKELRGYHKPIMIAGGFGNVRDEHVQKQRISNGASIVVLGGPAMLIGLGGGAASSVSSGRSSADLDYASVQRDNPEMERRCQEVIDRCWAMGTDNPIESIHDVGAGGLSNALPELVHDAERGAQFELRTIPNADSSMSPLELWCNESQERYVLAIAPGRIEEFRSICARERAPYAVVGEATERPQLIVSDAHFANTPIDMPLDSLLSKVPKKQRSDTHRHIRGESFDVNKLDISEAISRVLRLPTVGDKTFLVTIGDRTVSGLVSRDQMVGPWQVPVADAAVTLTDYTGFSGEAMAVGERPPVAILNAGAASRLAVGEAITNIASAPIEGLGRIKLSANWMAAAGHPGEDAKLYEAVKAVGEELCPALGIAIPVGKDSMSMKTVWEAPDGPKQMTSPLSLIITAFAPVIDVRKVVTPDLKSQDETSLLLVDLGEGRNRLGGSSLGQVYSTIGSEPPDLEAAGRLAQFFEAIQTLNQAGHLLAYHDRSDGGLLVTVLEMAFAGGMGVELNLDGLDSDQPTAALLFSEELGAVIQVKNAELPKVIETFEKHGLKDILHPLGWPRRTRHVSIHRQEQEVFESELAALRTHWSHTSWHMRAHRDDPQCAIEEQENALNYASGRLQCTLSFDPKKSAGPYINKGALPRVAILREQGVNGQAEMAAAFTRAGFEAVDVHMSDILSGRHNLQDMKVLAACGGFSYGDVLGAGEGWAKSILFSHRARDVFLAFFNRADTLSLGVCNGCQMLSNLRELIPGAELWPRFVENRAGYEARLSMVRIEKSPSIWLEGMASSIIPVAVAHGEGRAECRPEQLAQLKAQQLIGAVFVDGEGQVASTYPMNPNGSPDGVTSVTSVDGRVTLFMPHPERVFRGVQWSWRPTGCEDESPWMQIFYNARRFV